MSACIGPVVAAFPPTVRQDELWSDCFTARYTRRGSERLWASAGVRTRHAVVDPRFEDARDWSTGYRMERYTRAAHALSAPAVTGALSAAGIGAADVDLFAVVTCTGYGTPGVDILVARELGMPATLQRLAVGHMGCHAAIPALAAVSDAVVARRLTAVLLCVELPSLHVQPSSDDAEHLVAHSLFSDAAVAAVVAPDADGKLAGCWTTVDVVASTDADSRDDMTWTVTDQGFRMELSRRVPEVLARHVGPTVDRLLERNQLGRGDVRGWAIHPGGPRILDTCAHRLGLDADALSASTATLRDHGNCSSATIMLVLDRLTESVELTTGDPVVMIAFGPGLTMYAALLRRL